MEMIIQNETGNFTLHVRISDSKEYDFLKDVTELAQECLQCGNLIDMEMNSRRTAYVTKTKRGGQDLKEVDSKGENDE